MSYLDLMKARQFVDARRGLADAYSSEETPEQLAQRIQRARTFDVPTAAVDEIDPARIAQHQVDLVDWAAMETQAPYMTRSLTDAEFAGLVKDDITNTGLLETAVWKLAPKGGYRPEGIWETARFSGARGAYSIAANLPGFGSIDKKTQYARMLNDIRDKEAALAEGKSDAEVFGSVEDPTGFESRRKFDLTKDRQKEILGNLIQKEAETTAWANRMMGHFQQSELMERFGQSKTLIEALSIALSNPLEFMANVGPETLTQMAPSIPFMAMFGAGAPGVAATFFSSAGFDRSAQITEAMSDMGVDPTDADAIADVFMNPAKRALIEEKIKAAEKHAAMTGLFDAASFRLAGKTILPKRFTKELTPRGAQFANTLAQAPTQGVMGAAGEAFGQIAATGSVQSWSDVVAEFAGEFFGSPVEVMTAGIKATDWAQKREQRAAEKAKALQDAGKAMQAFKLMQRDPETARQYLEGAVREHNVETIYINPVSLQQSGKADEIRALSPTVNAKFEEALETGSEIAIPGAEYLEKIAPADDGAIASIAHTAGEPSYQQAQEDVKAVQENIADMARETMAERSASFQSEVNAVGKQIADDLKAIPEVTPEESAAVRATVQQVVSALAQDMRVSPLELWNKYGARILGEPRVRRDANGNLIVDEGATATGQQQTDATKGVRGEYFPALNLIARWKNANRSTLLHETGHLFLEMRLAAMRDLLAYEGPLNRGQQRVLEIGNAILEWAGVDSLDAWQALPESDRKAIHEKWARTYEAYVMEGEGAAPTKGLKKAFQAFTQMLKTVYTVIAAIPGQQLDDTTRELFNNIFLTSSQVRESQLQSSGVNFISVEDLGLSPVEGEYYTDAIEEMYAEAEAALAERNARLATLAKNLRKKAVNALKRGAKGRLREIYNEILEEAKKTRTWKAIDLLTNGKEDPNKEPRVDKNGKKHRVILRPRFFIKDLQELGYEDKQIKALEKAGFVTKKMGYRKMELKELAESLEYGNPKELIDDVLANTNLDDKLREKAAERFAAEHPEIKNDQAIEDAAAEAWFVPAKLRALNLEIRKMEEMIDSQVRTETRTMEIIARQYIFKQKLADVKPAEFARAANIARRKAKKAFIDGDVRQGIFFKRQEIYQSALAVAAREAKQQAKDLAKYARKSVQNAKAENVEGEYLEAAQRLIIAAGISTPQKCGLNPSEATLQSFLDAATAKHEVEIEYDPNFVAAMDRNPKEALSTQEGVLKLQDMLRQLMYVGRRVKHYYNTDKKETLAAVVAGLENAIEENAAARGHKEKENREDIGSDVKNQSLLRRIGFSHWRIPSLLAAIEGKREGMFFDTVVSGLDKCGDKAETLKSQYAKRLEKAFNPIMDAVKSKEKKTYAAIGKALTKMQVLAVALNIGNEGNLKRLIENPSTLGLKEVSREQIFALISEALTAQELAVVQEVWDVFESMRHETEAVHKRIKGRAPIWVQPTAHSIMSADGQQVELRGGYYPIVYDAEASGAGARLKQIQDEGDMTSLYNKGGVFDGHTKNRMAKLEKERPLSLTLRGAFEGLNRQIHYVAWAEWVNDTTRLFRNLDPVIRKFWGSEAMTAINQWIDDIRRAGRKEEGQSAELANLLRSNLSLAGIGLNFMTALVQPLGIVQSVAVLGPKWVGKGLQELMSNGPLGATKAAAEKSAMMRTRAQTQFRELTEVYAQVSGTTSKFRDSYMRLAYTPIVVMQSMVDSATWFGAYHKALAEGNTEGRAIALADRAVIDSQGSGRLQDLAGVERGGAWAKLWTVFYTFFNTALNTALVSGYTKDPIQRAVDWMMILAIQPVAESLLRSVIAGVGNDEDMDEDWWRDAVAKSGRDIVGFNLGMFVGLREVQWVVGEYNSYTGPGGARKLHDTGVAISKMISAFDEGELDEATVKAVAKAFGVWVGAPVTMLDRLYTGGKAIYDEETDSYTALFLGYNPH